MQKVPRYNHTQKYYWREPRCVKCAEKHYGKMHDQKE